MEREERTAAALEGYCRRNHLSFERVDAASLAIPLEGAQGHVLCLASAEPDRLILHALFAFTAPRSKRLLVAELVSRANYRIGVGALFIDLDDGEVGFRLGIPFAAGHLAPAQVDALMRYHLDAADRWLPAVAAVCFADMSPRAALELGQGTYPPDEVIARANEQLGQWIDTD